MALGGTVGELQERMSYDEFLHWVAFANIEPIGGARADIHHADSMVLLANINRNPKKQGPFKRKDFMLDWWAEREQIRPKDGKALLEKFRALTTIPGT